MNFTIKKEGFVKAGNDIIYLPDFLGSLTASFKRRVYTTSEKAYCDSFENSNLRYASTFAAKEAIYKALKQWDSELTIPWNKIEIERARFAGKPKVNLLFKVKHPLEISLSITHDGDYVWSIALISKL